MKIKKMKKLLFGLAPLALIGVAAPVVIASQTKSNQTKNNLAIKANIMAPLAMRVNPHGGDLAAFVNKLNDTSTDAKYEAMLEDPANQTIIANSSFYKTSLVSFKPETHTFGTNDITILVDKINVLSKSTEFNDDQKVMVGKWMLAKYSFTNFFTYKGLPIGKSFTQTQIETSHAGNLVNPLTSAPLQIGGAQVSIVGETGINTSWRAKNANDNVYNISNEGVLEYAFNAFLNSVEFQTMFNNLNANLALHTKNPTDMSMKQLFTAFISDALKSSQVLDDLKLPGMGSWDILKSNVDLSNVTTDDSLFVTLMNSPIGKTLYTDVAKEEGDYTSGDASFKQSKLVEIATKLVALFNPFEQKAQDYFANVETNGTETTLDNESSQEIIKFAKLVIKYSNNLQSDVQVRVLSDEFVDTQRNIVIKTGHNPDAWNSIPSNTICIDKITAGIDVGKTLIVYSNYDRSTINAIKKQSIFTTTKNYDENATLAMLTTSPEQIWHADETRWGYLTLSLNMNGVETNFTDSKTVSMKVEDHDDDDRFKNVNITQSYECHGSACHSVYSYSDPIPWKVSISDHVSSVWNPSENKNLVSGASIHFMWSNNNTQNDVRPFISLTSSVAEAMQRAYQDLQNQVSSWKANPSLNVNYDPTANLSYQITLKDITFDKILFQTYDDIGEGDTYANNIRFSGIHYNLDEEITQDLN